MKLIAKSLPILLLALFSGSVFQNCGQGFHSKETFREKNLSQATQSDLLNDQISQSFSDRRRQGTTPTPPGTFLVNFESAQNGVYDIDQLQADWLRPYFHEGIQEFENNSLKKEGRAFIVSRQQGQGNALRVNYPRGQAGFLSSTSFLTPIKFDLGPTQLHEELYLSYDLKFADNFEFVLGGKLPGFCGSQIDDTTPQTTGCNSGFKVPTGFDGWSVRSMWRENGQMVQYVYHPNQPEEYGEDIPWDFQAQPGVWYNVQHRVVMNTVDQANGIIEVWVDGELVLSKRNMEFRKTNNIGVNLFYFSTFYGGNDSRWAPSQDQHIDFDNFIFSKTFIK